ncbi:helix-turn-helix domain-containing protein [Streptacidiphilus sp. PAMC 29251]
MDLPIGDRIRHYRGQRSQEVVAGLAGVSVDYNSQIERGLRVPTIRVLHAIARELGVPTAALLAEAPAAAVKSPDTAAPAIAQALMGYGPPLSSAPVETQLLRERVEAAWRSCSPHPPGGAPMAPSIGPK